MVSSLSLQAVLLIVPVVCIDNGLARFPPMGFNSWNAFSSSVTAADLRTAADSFVSLGLAAAGYEYIISDDGWMAGRDATGRMYADEVKFPGGWTNLSAYIKSKGLKAGIYSAASSVVCSGRVGSLYNEYLDAETFASWGIEYIKYDNCGEYGMGNSRFHVWADAVNATGIPIVLSTEPYSLHPDPSHRDFAHLWRTTNDISPNYGAILDRADTNDKWAALAGPGSWGDPDMLEIGNGGLNDQQSRTHFGLWALMKAPLILGTALPNLSPAQLAIVVNKDVISVNQDALGVQGRKLAVNGAQTPRFVGIAPCLAPKEMGYNGVSLASLAWEMMNSSVIPSDGGSPPLIMVRNVETNRCLAMGSYSTFPLAPLLFTCNATDPTQAWVLPTGVGRLGGLLWFPAINSTTYTTGAAFTVGDSTLYTGPHGPDIPLPDANYGIFNITLTNYSPEPPCNNRDCDDYVPQQTWYYSQRQGGKLFLGHFAANHYRCFEPNCEHPTLHTPTTFNYCLAHVLSYSGSVGTGGGGGGDSSVWGGPLAGGDYILALANQVTTPANVSALFSWLEVPGVGDSTAMCGRELFTNTLVGRWVGGGSLLVQGQDIAMIRFTPC